MTKYSMLRISAFAAALAGVVLSVPAQAVEYVTNGGFDTGDLTGWELSGNAGSFSVVDFGGYPDGTGANFAWASPVGSLGYISQTLATVAGQALTVSGYYWSYGGSLTQFQVSLGGTTWADDSGIETSGWVPFSFNVIALGSDILKIGVQSSDWLYLDSFSVTGEAAQTPLPATLPLFVSGLGALGLLARRRIKRAA